MKNAVIQKDLLACDRVIIHLHSKQVDFSNRWKVSKVILAKNAYFIRKMESRIVFPPRVIDSHIPKYLIKCDL